MTTILTRADGTPIERPISPPADAPIADKIAWIRSVHDYNDAVSDAANQAFSDAFRKAVRS